MSESKASLLGAGEKDAGRITYQMLLTTILGAAGSAQFGWGIGVTNEPESVIESQLGLPANGFPFAIAVAASSMAAILGANVAGGLADRLGRRKFLLLTNVLYLIGGVLFIVAQFQASYAALVVGRVVVGLGIGAASAGCPLYLGEIAPAHLKGAYGSIGQLSVTIFLVLSQVAGIWMSTPGLWGWMMGVHAFLAGLSILTAPMLLESPRWLIAQGRVDEARKVLLAIRGYSEDAADAEIAGVQAASDPADAGKANPSVVAVLMDPVFRKPTLVACFLQLAQQLSGINAVFFFSTSFFKDAGINDAIYGTLAAGVVNVLATLLAMYLIDRLGRKPLLLVGSAGMALAGVALTVVLVAKADSMGSADVLGPIAVLLVLLYVTFFEIGLGSIPWLIGGELLPEGPRASGMAVAAGVNWIFTSVIAMGFQPVKTALGNYCFLPFVGFLVVTFLFALKYVPETKGKTPNELLAFFHKGYKPTSPEEEEEDTELFA